MLKDKTKNKLIKKRTKKTQVKLPNMQPGNKIKITLQKTNLNKL
jgi:hypothetical protein